MKKMHWVLSGLLALLVACKHEIINPGGLDPNTTGNGSGINGSICFETDVLPLFISGCAKSGCHDAGSQREGYQLDSWQNITKRGIVPGKAAKSKLYTVLFAKGESRMPQSPNPAFTVQQKKIIAQWINEGATNTTGCSVSCNSNSFLFNKDVLPVIQNNCVGCHNNSLASGGANFTTYEGIIAHIEHIPDAIQWKNSNQEENMPQTGKMSDCEIDIIIKWINAGHQNN